jgi:uncharacterized membrane protein
MLLSRGYKILLFVVIVCGVVFRVTNLDRKSYFEVLTALRVSGYDEHDEANPQLYTGQPVSAADVQKFQRPNSEKGLYGTMRGLARKEPQVPPLYFVLAVFGARLWNDTVIGTRIVAALSSVLALGALFWLCRELFASAAVAWWATALAAVSPLWLRYAQEARMYSTWLALLLAACALCIHVARTNKWQAWALYALAFALSLYTHPLGVLALGALGIYILARDQWHLTRRVRNFGIATALSLMAFLPWLCLIVLNFRTVRATLGYLNEARPLSYVLETIGLNFVHVFISLQPNEIAWLIFGVLVLGVLGVYAFYVLYQQASREAALFILTLILLYIVPFVVMDLVWGGFRSTFDHYMLPAAIGIEIAFAFLFARMLAQPVSRKAWHGVVWQTAAVVLLVSSLVSNAVNWQAKTWWGILQTDLDVARVLNATPRAFIVSDQIFSTIAKLSYLVRPDARFVLTKHPETLTLPAGAENTYVLNPSDALRARLEQTGNTLEVVYQGVRNDLKTVVLYRLARHE